MLNIASIIERNAALMPNKKSLIEGERTMTFAELNAASAQVANGLSSIGISKGDRVALACPNIFEFPVVYYGILKTGAIVIPVSTLLTPREVTFLLQDSGAKAYFCFEGTKELPMGQVGIESFKQSPTCEHFIMIQSSLSRSAGEGRGEGVVPQERTSGTTPSPSPLRGSPPSPAGQERANFKTLSDFMANQPPVFDTVMCDANDAAFFLYTSGTTGTPKGAEITHSNVMPHLLNIALWLRMDSRDISLVFMPLFHTLAMNGQMNMTLMCGGTVVLMARFKPDEVLKQIAKHGVTISGGTPTVYAALLNLPNLDTDFDLPAITKSLRLGFSGGAPMAVELMNQVKKKFGIHIVEAYGLSEVVAVATGTHIELPHIPGSAGQPLAGIELRIAGEDGKFLSQGEAGEVVIRGAGVMKGYWNNPEATKSAFFPGGWFRTGDIGRLDEAGNIFIVDRLKDMILRGGYNVYPREIEEVLMTHSAISQVAVIGVPHIEYGEEVKAVVTLKSGQTVSPEEIMEWSKNLLAKYKYPRMVEIRETLPMTPSGKIMKRLLRA